MKSGPRSPQLEKALAQKRRPNTTINKLKKKKVKPLKKKTFHLFILIHSLNNYLLGVYPMPDIVQVTS